MAGLSACRKMLSDVTSNAIAQSPAATPLAHSHGWHREDLLPVLSGISLALSFPPIGLTFLAFVALGPLFLYLDNPATFERTARAGLLTGIPFFGITLSWLNSPGNHFVDSVSGIRSGGCRSRGWFLLLPPSGCCAEGLSFVVLSMHCAVRLGRLRTPSRLWRSLCPMDKLWILSHQLPLSPAVR